jgi:hypothetical protein
MVHIRHGNLKIQVLPQKPLRIKFQDTDKSIFGRINSPIEQQLKMPSSISVHRPKHAQTTKNENIIPNNPTVTNAKAKAANSKGTKKLLVNGINQTNKTVHQKTMYANARTP